MNTTELDHRIDALLDDPLVSLMIRADSVDRAGLARELAALGRSVEKRHINDKKPRAAWSGMSFALCGAYAL